TKKAAPETRDGLETAAGLSGLAQRGQLVGDLLDPALDLGAAAFDRRSRGRGDGFLMFAGFALNPFAGFASLGGGTFAGGGATFLGPFGRFLDLAAEGFQLFLGLRAAGQRLDDV